MKYLVPLLALLAMPVLVTPAFAAPVKKHPPLRRPIALVRDWTMAISETPGGGVRMGNPQAKIALIEYGSRTCPHCAHFAAEGLPALKAKYIATGQVSYEFRDFPIHDAVDIGPILLGRCVPATRFFALLDAMMANQATLIGRDAQVPQADTEALQQMTPTAVAAYFAHFYGYDAFAQSNGISAARVKACLADSKALDAVVARANVAERDFHVQSTPTFILNGKPVAGASDLATLEPALRAAGAK